MTLGLGLEVLERGEPFRVLGGPGQSRLEGESVCVDRVTADGHTQELSGGGRDLGGLGTLKPGDQLGGRVSLDPEVNAVGHRQ